ncbi:NADPH:quinone reductase [Olsenella sp. KH3B4]|uniref:alcohol dehydrogenase catalytic domain-containing protein n=1 Tax=Olsenella sp. KH3B4 TaxID=1855394 RepID=UPI0008CF3AB5|nr:zinc-binding dehydrogenase [Olsenella sp. KH3B4]SET18190.1 NADPH:quinone reductase [Olsenella sp. KH3B4]
MGDSIPKTMRAIAVHEAGGPEVLRLEHRPVPALKPGWSLVHVRARGLNHSEVFTRQGLSPSVRFPRILGIECVGEVAATTDAARLPEGQKVVSIMGEMGRAFDGSYADYALLPNQQLYPIESDLPWEVLAAIPETYYTAYGSLLNLHLEAGQTVLVRGATSGVGMAFAKLARSMAPGLRLVGATRSEARADLLLKGGYDDTALDLDGKLQVEGRPCQRVLELVGPATLKDTCSHVSEGGIVCSTGQLVGVWYMEDFDPIVDLPPNGFLTSFYSGNVDEGKLAGLIEYVEQRGVDMRPTRVFSLDRMADAHRFLESSEGFGKIVVTE